MNRVIRLSRGPLRCAIIVFSALLLLAPFFAGAAEGVAYRLGTGDKLRVTVYDESTLSGDFDVNDQGFIGLPLIGQVAVAGKTLAQAEAAITERYGKDYLVNPRVNLQVLNYRPFFILGEVKSPGSYPYQNGMTVVNAVVLAGGYTTRANRDRIYVKRIGAGSAAEKEINEDDVVLPGDIIRVAERFF
jgi:protein involved in polysaccharide export with SLBB domain